MIEPTSTTTGAVGFTAIMILVLGPKLGPVLAPVVGDFLLILAGALGGVMHSVAKVNTASVRAAAFYVLRWVLTALILAGGTGVLIEKTTSLPATQWPGVVAFLITFLADKWPAWLSAILARKAGQATDGEARP
ncbi:MAG: hypothetical protein AB7P37_03215 [Ramlibacter sp.]